MVKVIDDIPEPIDHIGLDLWRAGQSWRSRLHREMAARGHDWYLDARGSVASSLDIAGTSQAELVVRMGISKQGVQQLLDRLEADGIVQRVPDPQDGRGKRIVYTARGLKAVRDAHEIKRQMGRDLRQQLGAKAFDQLRALLVAVSQAFEE